MAAEPAGVGTVLLKVSVPAKARDAMICAINTKPNILIRVGRMGMNAIPRLKVDDGYLLLPRAAYKFDWAVLLSAVPAARTLGSGRIKVPFGQ
jgi:hypothetical protein